MENCFSILPHELIFEIFKYIDQKNDVDSFQDALHFSDIIINYERLYILEFSEHYKSIKPVIVYDKRLYKYLNWREIYLDHKYLIFNISLDNRTIPFHVNESRLINVSYSTLNVLYSSHLYNDYEDIYNTLKYFDETNLRSYITPWILYIDMRDAKFDLNVKDLIKIEIDKGVESLNNFIDDSMIYTEEAIIIITFILFFEERSIPSTKIHSRIISKDIITFLYDKYKNYIRNEQEGFRSNINTYYFEILKYMKSKIES